MIESLFYYVRVRVKYNKGLLFHIESVRCSNMISYDERHKQILSPLCRKCPDEYFSPIDQRIPHVGCCSYSPVFTLFDIHKMLKDGQRAFFLEKIYNNESNTIRPYNIVIHANVHPLFDDYDTSTLSDIEREDIKIKFSVCQFFEAGKGCGLPPQFKTDICRSFICSTVEEQISHEKMDQLTQWIKRIKQETSQFNTKHQNILSDKGLDIKMQLHDVLDYLEHVDE
jgi:hypothetical protein